MRLWHRPQSPLKATPKITIVLASEVVVVVRERKTAVRMIENSDEIVTGIGMIIDETSRSESALGTNHREEGSNTEKQGIVVVHRKRAMVRIDARRIGVEIIHK